MIQKFQLKNIETILIILKLTKIIMKIDRVENRYSIYKVTNKHSTYKYQKLNCCVQGSVESEKNDRSLG